MLALSVSKQQNISWPAAKEGLLRGAMRRDAEALLAPGLLLRTAILQAGQSFRLQLSAAAIYYSGDKHSK